jgi:hypothetical protein
MRILFGLVAAVGLAGCSGGESDTELPPTYKLTFSGVGYTAHEGQKVVAAVEDDAGDQQGKQEATVAGGAFQFTFDELVAGDYTIYWFADLSGDGACQAPPADHAWSHAFTIATTDAIVDHVHATDFNPDACTHLQ